MRFHRHALAFGCLAFISVSSAMAQNSNPARRQFDVPSQDLKYALRSVTRTAGLELFARTDDLQGKRSPELHAQMSTQEALDALLSGTDLKAELNGTTVYIRKRSKSAATDQQAADKSEDAITVVGSRIRGAKPTSPVISASRETIEALGFNDLGSFTRSIPQNFSGGQNPGVIFSSQPGSENFSSSSTLNLRGLGPDATLTLVNGHRLSYDATNQGIDIASIPLQAINRIDIVADGASALYGSDAVGGVANVVLRRDYEGLATSARFGGATDGGDVQQQYDVVSGRQWSSGGFMLAGDFNRSTPIDAGDRSYTRSIQKDLSLLRAQRQYSSVLTAHQSLLSAFEFDLDAHLDHHTSRFLYPYSETGDVYVLGFIFTPSISSYSVSPSVKTHIAGGWLLSVQGTAADSDSRALIRVFSDDAEAFHNKIRYDNHLGTGELSAEGPLFTLPGGTARLAIGAGARLITIDAAIHQIFPDSQLYLVNYSDSQTVAFGYGEVSLPLIGRANALPWVQELQVTGAVRYEHYNRIGSIVTPKVGVRYQPVTGLTLEGSWGTSFKAPTLSQQNTVYETSLLPASLFFPEPIDGRDVILVSGGSHQLKPERAVTWTTSLTFEPSFIPGLRAELSHFDIRYRDRVVDPLPSLSPAFTPPYDSLILRNPSQDQIGDVIAAAPLGLDNQTDHDYDPANVGSIIFDQYQNASRQHIEGFDFAVNYATTLGRNQISLQGDASYLRSNQKLSAAQPTLQRAGTIFNPPHWRSRLSVNWVRDALSATADFNYQGSLKDNRTDTIASVGHLGTVDLIGRVRITGSGVLRGIALSASVQNLFNSKPPVIRHSGDNALTYDATNYSSIGRLASLTISKAW